MRRFFRRIYLVLQIIYATMYDRTVYMHQREDGTFEELDM